MTLDSAQTGSLTPKELGIVMRLASILTAIVVAAGLYAFVIERDAVLAIARSRLNMEPVAASNTDFGQNSATEVAAAGKGPSGESETESTGAVRVVAIRSNARPVKSGVTVRGQTEALRFVDIRSQASGLVVSEPLRKGAFVSEGQVVCVLDPGSKFADLKEARARFEEAAVNEMTASKLAEEGFATQNRRNSAKATLESAEAAVERAQVAIDRLDMTAPFDGLLESDAAETGSLLQPGSLCARVVQLDPIKIVGHLSDAEVDRIQAGNEASARFTSGRTTSGKVTYISRSGDPETRTFRLEIEVANTDLSIRDGSAVEVFIASASELAHLVPQSAMTLNDAGQIGLRTVEGGKASFNPIRIVRDTPEGAWVKGLPEKADVIVVGHEYVVEGSPVLVSYRDPAS